MNNCDFIIDVEATKKENKLVIICVHEDSDYHGIIEFEDETLREMIEPIQTFLWEMQCMSEHVEWKSEEIKNGKEVD